MATAKTKVTKTLFCVPVSDSLPQTVVQHLRWIMQKDLLGQDVFLIGPPGPLRRSIAMQYLVSTHITHTHANDGMLCIEVLVKLKSCIKISGNKLSQECTICEILEIFIVKKFKLN